MRQITGERRAGALIVVAAILSLCCALPATAAGACSRFSPTQYSFDNGQQTWVTPYGGGATVITRIACEDGTPAPSGTVVLAEDLQLSTGQLTRWDSQSEGISDSSPGVVSFTVAPGPSRQLFFAYVDPSATYFTVSSTPLSIITRVRPRFHIRGKVRRLGGRSTFYGSLPGPFVSGRPAIALQARSGHKWRTFKVASLNANGKFNGIYRFTRTSRPTIYHFRAKPVTGGVEYPYDARASKQRGVAVIP